MSDEELQDEMANGLQGSSADERAYRRVFDALQREPSIGLSPGFAHRVMSRLQPKASQSRDVLWLSLGVCSLVIAMIIAIVMTGFTLNWGAFKFISSYPGLIAFAIAFVLALQWADKRLVRKAGV
jgi:hypothetical protein